MRDTLRDERAADRGAATPTGSDEPFLAVSGLSKVFQGQRALDDVSLELRRGEVHALLGQNGSGKSTLIKILAGYHQPAPGAQATVDGRPLELGSSQAAHDAGLRFIHQDLAVIESLSVVDNLALGERYRGRRWLSDRRERQAAREVFASYGIDLDVDAPLGSLGPAQRAMAAIVRALHHGDAARGLLVLDEPTAALPESEKDRLFALVERVRDAGGTVLYVTHRLPEVFDLADRVTVLRDGRRVATRSVAELDHDGLVELIVGRPLDALYPEATTAPRSDRVLHVAGLAGGRLAALDVDVHAGEIVGIVGLTGSGIEDVLPLIFGGSPRGAGVVELDGRPVPADPRRAIAAGLAFAPGDRKRLSAITTWTLRENVTLPRLSSRPWTRWMSPRSEARDVLPHLERFGVVPSDPEARFSSLSGGNQQKTVLARWMRTGARAFLFEEPTAGVDVGAKSAIYTGLAEVAADGAAILVATSDFEEACSLCDRVLVLRDGRLGAVLTGARRTVEDILGEALRTDDHQQVTHV